MAIDLVPRAWSPEPLFDEDIFAVDLGRWKPELHPRDSEGQFRDKWGLSGAPAQNVERLLARFNPPPFRSNDHAASHLKRRRRPRSKKQQEALDYFLGREGNEDIQSSLRAGMDLSRSGGPTAQVKELDQMMTPLQDDLIVSRVMGPDAFGLPPEGIAGVEEWSGQRIDDLGYAPTSVGDPWPIDRPHVEMRILVPRGTRAIVVGDDGPNARTVILDREQPLQLGTIQKDGRGGWYVMATVSPKVAGPGTPPSRALGRALPATERADAVKATPEAFERRGLAPEAGGLTPEEPPERFGEVTPVPRPGPAQAAPEAPAAGPVQEAPTVPAPAAKKAAPTKAIQEAGGEVPEGAGRVTREGEAPAPREKITRPEPRQVIPEAQARAQEVERQNVERQKMLDERQARLDRAEAVQRQAQERLLKRQEDDNARLREENEQLRREQEARALPQVTPEQQEQRGIQQQDRILSRDKKLRGDIPDYPRNAEEDRISEDADAIRRQRGLEPLSTPEQEAARDERRRERAAAESVSRAGRRLPAKEAAARAKAERELTPQQQRAREQRQVEARRIMDRRTEDTILDIADRAESDPESMPDEAERNAIIARAREIRAAREAARVRVQPGKRVASREGVPERAPAVSPPTGVTAEAAGRARQLQQAQAVNRALDVDQVSSPEAKRMVNDADRQRIMGEDRGAIADSLRESAQDLRSNNNDDDAATLDTMANEIDAAVGRRPAKKVAAKKAAAKKAAPVKKERPESTASLRRRAKEAGIPGYTRMDQDQLRAALTERERRPGESDQDYADRIAGLKAAPRVRKAAPAKKAAPEAHVEAIPPPSKGPRKAVAPAKAPAAKKVAKAAPKAPERPVKVTKAAAKKAVPAEAAPPARTVRQIAKDNDISLDWGTVQAAQATSRANDDLRRGVSARDIATRLRTEATSLSREPQPQTMRRLDFDPDTIRSMKKSDARNLRELAKAITTDEVRQRQEARKAAKKAAPKAVPAKKAAPERPVKVTKAAKKAVPEPSPDERALDALYRGEVVHLGPEDLERLLASSQEHPNGAKTNLAHLDVEGFGTLFATDKPDSLPRDQMPQLGSTAGEMQAFFDVLQSEGIKIRIAEIDPTTLKPSQSEISAAKTAKLYKHMKAGGWLPGGLLVTSQDGYVVDGHHRWSSAAAVRASGDRPDMTVTGVIVDADIDTVLAHAARVAKYESLETDREAGGAPAVPGGRGGNKPEVPGAGERQGGGPSAVQGRPAGQKQAVRVPGRKVVPGAGGRPGGPQAAPVAKKAAPEAPERPVKVTRAAKKAAPEAAPEKPPPAKRVMTLFEARRFTALDALRKNPISGDGSEDYGEIVRRVDAGDWTSTRARQEAQQASRRLQVRSTKAIDDRDGPEADRLREQSGRYDTLADALADSQSSLATDEYVTGRRKPGEGAPIRGEGPRRPGEVIPQGVMEERRAARAATKKAAPGTREGRVIQIPEGRVAKKAAPVKKAEPAGTTGDQLAGARITAEQKQQIRKIAARKTPSSAGTTPGTTSPSPVKRVPLGKEEFAPGGAKHVDLAEVGKGIDLKSEDLSRHQDQLNRGRPLSTVATELDNSARAIQSIAAIRYGQWQDKQGLTGAELSPEYRAELKRNYDAGIARAAKFQELADRLRRTRRPTVRAAQKAAPEKPVIKRAVAKKVTPSKAPSSLGTTPGTTSPSPVKRVPLGKEEFAPGGAKHLDVRQIGEGIDLSGEDRVVSSAQADLDAGKAPSAVAKSLDFLAQRIRDSSAIRSGGWGKDTDPGFRADKVQELQQGYARADRLKELADRIAKTRRPTVRAAKKAAPARKVVPERPVIKRAGAGAGLPDPDATLARLSDFDNPPSREEAHALLAPASRAQLQGMAKELSVPKHTSLSMSKLRDEIVEGTTGRRLDSIATRGFRGLRPGEPGTPAVKKAIPEKAPGTAEGKLTAARLTPGTRIVLEQDQQGNWRPTNRRTNVTSFEVTNIEPAQGRRRQRVRVTAQGPNGEEISINASPSQTFRLEPEGGVKTGDKDLFNARASRFKAVYAGATEDATERRILDAMETDLRRGLAPGTALRQLRRHAGDRRRAGPMYQRNIDQGAPSWAGPDWLEQQAKNRDDAIASADRLDRLAGLFEREIIPIKAAPEKPVIKRAGVKAPAAKKVAPGKKAVVSAKAPAVRKAAIKKAGPPPPADKDRVKQVTRTWTLEEASRDWHGFKNSNDPQVGDDALIQHRGQLRQGVVTRVDPDGRVHVDYTTEAAIKANPDDPRISRASEHQSGMLSRRPSDLQPMSKERAKEFEANKVRRAIARRLREARTEEEAIGLLAGDTSLTSAKLREVADELGIEIPPSMRAKSALQLHIAERVTANRNLPPAKKAVPERPTIRRAGPVPTADLREKIIAAKTTNERAKVLREIGPLNKTQWRQVAKDLGVRGMGRSEEPDIRRAILANFEATGDLETLERLGGVPSVRSLDDDVRAAGIDLDKPDTRWYHGASSIKKILADGDNSDPESLRTRAGGLERQAQTERRLADMVEGNRTDQPDRVAALREAADERDRTATILRRHAGFEERRLAKKAAPAGKAVAAKKATPSGVGRNGLPRDGSGGSTPSEQPPPTPDNPQSPWGQARDDPRLSWSRVHGRPGNYDQVDRVYTADSKEDARAFLETRSDDKLDDIAEAGEVRRLLSKDRDKKITQIIEGIREPETAPRIGARSKKQDITPAAQVPAPTQTPSARGDKPDGPPLPRFAGERVTDQSGVIIKRDRPKADEPVYRPNGGADQGNMHLDSSLGELWSTLYMDDREPNSFVNELARLGDTLGMRGNGDLEKDVLPKLRDLKARASDKAVADRIQQTIDEIDAPQVSQPDLPEGTPDFVRNYFKELAKIPTARKTGSVAGTGGYRDTSLFNEKVDLIRRLMSVADDVDYREIERKLAEHDFHEGTDGAFRIWKLNDDTFSPFNQEMRKWVRSLAARDRENRERGDAPTPSAPETGAPEVPSASRGRTRDTGTGDTSQDRARQRLEAREKHERIAKADGAVDLAKELYQIDEAARGGTSREDVTRALRERLEASVPGSDNPRDTKAQGYESLRKGLLKDLDQAPEGSSSAFLMDKLFDALRRRGVGVTHSTNTIHQFDPATMDTNQDLKPGDRVIVTSPGLIFRDKDGVAVVLSKPKVRRLGPEDEQRGPLGERTEAPRPLPPGDNPFADVPLPTWEESKKQAKVNGGIDLLRDFKTEPTLRSPKALLRADRLTRKMRTYELQSMAERLGLVDYKQDKQDVLRNKVMRELRRRLGVPEPEGQADREALERLKVEELIRRLPPGVKLGPASTKADIIELIVGDGPRRDLHVDESPGTAALRKSFDTGTEDQRYFGGGSMGQVALVRAGDGREMVRKRMATDWFMAGERQADAEQLMSELGLRIGAPQPAIYRPHDRTVYMDRVPGKLASKYSPEEIDAAIRTPEGRRIAILDAITGNSDRHNDNWMIVDGKPVGIDNSLSFTDDVHVPAYGPDGEILPGGTHTDDPFKAHYQYRTSVISETMGVQLTVGGDWTSSHSFSRQELQGVRKELVVMKPQFKKLNREDWYNEALGRLDALIKRAGPESGGRPVGAVGRAPVKVAGRAPVRPSLVDRALFPSTVRAQEAAARPARIDSRGVVRGVVSVEPNGTDVQDILRRDTGPGGVPVRDLTLSDYGYKIDEGTIWRRNGVSYLIEHGSTPEERARARQMLTFLQQHNDALPTEVKGYQKAYTIASGGNPTDAFWGQRYNLSNFWSSASGGSGNTVVWHGGGGRETSRIATDLNHELGHNIDYAIKADPGVYLQATLRDGDNPGLRIKGGFTPTDEPRIRSIVEGERSRNFPHGVTAYGTSSPQEDYAEAVSLYLRSKPVGMGAFTTGGVFEPMWFRDLWPERATFFDAMFPEYARRQRAEIARIRALPVSQRRRAIEAMRLVGEGPA